MNKEQQKIVDDWWARENYTDHTVTISNSLIERKSVDELVNHLLATQDTGDKYGNDLRNEYKRGFRDRGKKVDDRLATQDTGGGEVLRYNLENGEMNIRKDGEWVEYDDYKLLATKDTGEWEVCVWTYDDDSDSWDGTCGVKWILSDGTPKEHDMKFCPRCGAVLKAKEGR